MLNVQSVSYFISNQDLKKGSILNHLFRKKNIESNKVLILDIVLMPLIQGFKIRGKEMGSSVNFFGPIQ